MSSPKKTSIAERLGALSPEQRALLEKQLKKKGIELSRLEITPRDEVLDSYPLSFAQQRLWFIQQLAPRSPSYNISTPRRIRGMRLDPRVLRRALAEIVRRHESLRTTFATEGGSPVQIVHREMPQELPLIDLSALPCPRADAETLRLTTQQRLEPFDLERGPLLRTALVRLREDEHAVLITMNHIVSDGWSLNVFHRELLTLYQAALRGAAAPLPALPVQYVDFALWQRKWLAGEILERQLRYWKEQLAGAPPLLELPIDKPRPPQSTSRGGAVPLLLPPALTASLRALGRSQQSTLFVVLLAAFSVCLRRVTGRDDLLMGSPLSGRGREEIAGLIGFFVNTLVLRVDTAGAGSFRELLARAQEVSREAHVHQDLPFEKLVEELHPERTLQHSPIFQVSVGMQNDPREEAQAAAGGSGLTIVPQASRGHVAAFDLALSLTEAPKVVRGVLSYKLDLFEHTTVQRMASFWTRTLETVAGDPDAALASLLGASPAERQQLIVEWNEPRHGDPGGELVPTAFAAQARRSPRRVAVTGEDSEMTFGELDERANRLANHLRRLGVGPEVVVGFSMRRSPEMVVGLLAILKAGGAYLPLDPDYPADRLRFMLDDAQRDGPRLVVTTRDLTSQLPERSFVLLDEDAAEIAAHTADDPFLAAGVAPGSPAYVIYTSGSTGRPKGVVIGHGALGKRLDWSRRNDTYEGFTYLQKTSISFDVSVMEIFLPLVSGGRTVLIRPGGQWDPAYLLRRIAEQKVTLTSFPPSALGFVVEQPGFAELRDLRVLSSAGEALPAHLVHRVRELLPVRMHNRYGPTEATVGTLSWTCRADEEGIVPIGRPIAAARVILADRQLAPVPIGIPGEVCLGGVSLARGYLFRPGLTAERFVPDPWAAEPGERLYRTGDLARSRGDGVIDFLGRVDHQVKVRGFRVELGEIEVALEQHPAVRKAVVLDRRDERGTVVLAAFVEAPEEAPGGSEVRAFLGDLLPGYMVPAAVTVLAVLPRMANGKVDRGALARLEDQDAGGDAESYVAPRNEIEATLSEIWQRVLGVEKVGVRDNFFDLGGHSLSLVQVQSDLERALGRQVPMVDLFRFPSIAVLAEFLDTGEDDGEQAAAGRRRAQIRGSAARRATDVAVVGMNGRYPGADNLDELWRNLAAGVESITFFTDEELLEAGLPAAMIEQPGYVKAQAVLGEIGTFDARLFGMSPREAELTDPQHRLFLECAWGALEDAGYDPESWDGSIGVFAGAGLGYYWVNLLATPDLLASVGRLQISLGNDKDFLPTRVSYKLDLKGPSFTVQTACSTSLVATHVACQSLLAGECDMALAGGVSAAGGKNGYLYREEGILSPDGRCRSFDARAGGTVGGEGVGIVVLKRLDDALADGDTVHAVIKGSAINNDGAVKVGFTAPSVEGQAKVIAEAQAVAGVGPETVGYVEGHGSATPLGDPIEVAALRQVFGAGPEKSCALGAIKSNIGHTNTAAGVAGLIKTVMAIEHRQIPPSPNFEQPNPELRLPESPFYVPTELTEWKRRDGEPRRAGVSSFGLGGTNVHVIVEEAPAVEPSGPSRPAQLLLLSAAGETSLEGNTDRLAEVLEAHPEAGLADVAHTLQVGRRRLAQRRFLVCHEAGEAAAALAARDPRRVFGGVGERVDRPVAFLLSGLGDHYAGMGRELYAAEPSFRAEIDRCAELLAPVLGLDLREMLFPAEEAAPAPAAGLDFKSLAGRGEAPQASGPLARTRLAQPAVFVLEVALARLWMEWGVVPEALIGYSLGEYTAAHLAGVLSLEDALALVAARAAMIDELPAGVMLAVPLPAAELAELLPEEVSLAASNSPAVAVAAGPEEAVAALEELLEGRELVSRRLSTTHAFHSTMMEPIAAAFAERLGKVALSPPEIPILSNVTGTWLTAEEATDPGYWVRHLCGTVRFAEGMEELLAGDRVLLEVGPGQALATSALQHPARGPHHVALPSLRDVRDQQSDVAFLLGTLGRLWVAGARVDWRGFATHERRRRVPLPKYAFDHQQRYWAEPPQRAAQQSAPAAAPAAEVERQDLADWFYAPSWRPSGTPAAGADEGFRSSFLVFLDPRGLGAALAGRLAERGAAVVTVEPGEGFAQRGEGAFVIDPRRPQDYESLAAQLVGEQRLPRTFVHLWSVGEPGAEASGDRCLDLGFYSVLFLAQALGVSEVSEPVRLLICADGAVQVREDEPLVPEKAALLGPCRVIPQEYDGAVCGVVDLGLPPEGGDGAAVDQLLAEIDARPRDPVVAWRGRRRWVQSFEPLRLERSAAAPPAGGGCVLITGGFGGMGLTFARDLAQQAGARLVLTSRSALPEPGTWDSWLAEHGADDPISRKIRDVRELEQSGAEVLTAAADVADREAMAAVVAAARQRFGGVHGVIHTAGLPGEGLAQLKTRESVEKMLRSKVGGARVLDEVCGEELGFMVLCSSAASIIGGLGQLDYSAANNYLDAFAHARSAAGRPTLAVNWGLWREVGMGARAEVSDEVAGEHRENLRHAIAPQEGAEALRRALDWGMPQVVVTSRDLQASIERNRKLKVSGVLSGRAQGRQGRAAHPRPPLATAYVAPRGEAETELAGIWQDLLGLEAVGVHDVFFELGGDSLLATQMITRIRRIFQVQLTLASIFDAPTVAGLAEVMESQEGEDDLSRLEDLFSEVTEMSEEDAEAQLASQDQSG